MSYIIHINSDRGKAAHPDNGYLKCQIDLTDPLDLTEGVWLCNLVQFYTSCEIKECLYLCSDILKPTAVNNQSIPALKSLRGVNKGMLRTFPNNGFGIPVKSLCLDRFVLYMAGFKTPEIYTKDCWSATLHFYKAKE